MRGPGSTPGGTSPKNERTIGSLLKSGEEGGFERR